MADGEPLLLEQVHLPAARFPGLLAGDLEHGSLYELLTERYGTRVVRAREALEPVALPAARGAAARRRAATGRRCSSRASRSTADGSPVEFARSYVRGDRTRYYVERVVVRSSPPIRGRRRRRRRRTDRRTATRDDRRQPAVPEPARRSTCERSEPSPRMAVLALVVGACGGTTATPRRSPPPSGGGASAPASDGAAAPGDTPSPIGGSTPAPGQTEIRWYCCLGGGDAPEQVDGREEGRRGVQRQPPEHPRDVRGRPVRRRERRPRDPDRLGQRPRHRRSGRHRRRERLPRPVAGPRAAHREDELRPVGLPARRRRHLQARRGPGRHPVRDLPVGAVLHEEPVRGGRPQRAAAQVRRQVHDARRHRRSTGTTTRSREIAQDPDRRQERQGRDRGRLRPRRTSSSGASSPSATTCAAWAPTSAPARSPAADGKTAQIPDAGRPRWKYWYDGMWTDHITHDRARSSEPGHQPRGLPVLHRQGRDERELPVVDLRRRGRSRATGTWARPVLQRQGRPRRSTPTRSGSSRTPSTPTRRSRS